MPPKKEKKRLDVLLIERGLVESRAKAQALILANQVKVFDPETNSLQQPFRIKPGSLYPENTKIDVEALPRFVSRGGEKLDAALIHWNIQVKDKVCLDVGASTGGFTDCLLQNGAKKVYAIDVGHGQLHPKIRQDPRVVPLEGTHILKWVPPWRLADIKAKLEIDKTVDSVYYKPCEVPALAVIDVSFISLEHVLIRTSEILEAGASILALVKPQFEVGQKYLKKGIVKDDLAREASIDKIEAGAIAAGLIAEGRYPCPLEGAKGNREEWLYIKLKREIT